MKLYLVSRTDGVGYDEFDSFVMAHKSEDALKKHIQEHRDSHTTLDGHWGLHSDFREDHYEVEYIGTARQGTEAGEVFIASFNAG